MLLWKWFLKVVLVSWVTGETIRSSEQVCRVKQTFANCSNSRLTDIPLDLSPTITEIDASKNQLTAIQWPLPYFSLIILNLSKNDIHRIGFHGFKHLFNLVTLDLSFNKIKYLSYIDSNFTFYNTPRLVELSLKGNPLKSLGLDPIKSESIKRLDVSECDIRDLDGDVSLLQMPNLMSLLIYRNPLAKIDTLLSKSLEEVHIKECQLRYVKPEFYMGLPKLRFLDLSKNSHLSSISRTGRASSLTLTILKAEHCSIGYLDLQDLPNLEKLHIKGNKISRINEGAFAANGKLKEIDLSMNWIQHIDAMGFYGALSLIRLDLSGNKIVNLGSSMSPLSRLIHLNISNNQIITIEGIESAFNLLLLDASHCEIPSVTLDLFRLSQLEIVNLSRNAIGSLPIGMSSYTLIELNLANNRLTEVAHNWFKHFPRLKTLYLDGNRLTEPFHKDTIKRLQHVKLHLQDNPWRCNCGESNYRHFYKHLLAKNSLRSLHCHGPVNVSGLTWEVACFETETEASIKKNLKKNAWLPMLLAALTTIGIVFLLYFLRKRLTCSEEEMRTRNDEHDRDSSQIHPPVRSPPRIEAQLPSYEEALLMPKPKTSTKSHADTQTNASFLGSARSLDARAKHSLKQSPSSNSL